jgi:hypothetical protein
MSSKGRSEMMLGEDRGGAGGARSGTLIDAFIAGAADYPDASLVVASETRPAEARLAEIVAQGRGIGDELRALGESSASRLARTAPAAKS